MAFRILVTGGAGFIGSNYVRLVLGTDPGVEVINVDALTYAGNLENLENVSDHPRYRFVKADICDRAALESIFAEGVHGVVHFAAESHVDRSIADSRAFVRTNVEGTQVLLDLARRYGVQRFVHISTDEVYGSLGPTGRFTESSPVQPRNPYAASKAASDLLALSYCHTYGLPVIVTRCSNNYGPYQFPEKFIPLVIANALEEKPIPVYGDGLQVRDWIYVEDHCRAVHTILQRGRPGEVYNIGGDGERFNIDVVRAILRLLGKPETLIRHVADRPGHDRRYAMDYSKLRSELGWSPRETFESGLRRTVGWYLENTEWLRRVRSGAYLDYYERQYGGRLAVAANEKESGEPT